MWRYCRVPRRQAARAMVMCAVMSVQQDDNMMTREQLKQKYKSVSELEDDFM
jgi:hypothetical protein